MHQSTKRRICRLVFLVGCILPTLAVVAWAAVERLPSTSSHRLAIAERMLALGVSANALATPTPGVFRARGVTLTNVETGATVLTAEVATIRTKPSFDVELSNVQLSAGEVPQLAQAAHRALVVDWPASVAVRMTAASWLADQTPIAGPKLADGTIVIRLTTNNQGGKVLGRQLLVQLGRDSTGPQLQVDRNRQVTPPATKISLDTANAKIPTAWIAQLGGLIAGGPEAVFAGKASFTHSAATCSGELSGVLSGASLAELTQLPIDGVGTVQDLQVQWSSGRVVNARGTLVSHHGSMHSSVAKTLQSLLYRTSQPWLNRSGNESIDFGQLAVMFTIDSSSLALWGACPSATSTSPPCVIDGDGQVLFGPPEYSATLTGVSAVLARHGLSGAAALAVRLPGTLAR